jgi:pimeloyl-ACP methyl ester carboxylesterase
MLFSRRRGLALAALLTGMMTVSAPWLLADVVTLKNGTVYRGLVDKDVPLVQIYDGLKRIVVRETKVAQINQADAPEKLEQFLPKQPLKVIAGQMPAYAHQIQTTPWDDSGRRTFTYEGPRSKKLITMTQGIYSLNPSIAKFAGIDGLWQGQIATSQIPKKSVLAILGKLDQNNQEYRLRMIRFLIQSAWFAEAKTELDRLAKDFPDLKDKAASVRQTVLEIEAQNFLTEVEVRRKASQFTWVYSRLKSFPADGIPGALQVAVRDALRREENQATLDKALADSIQKVANALPKNVRTAWKARLLEVLKGINEVPDAVRERFSAFSKAEADPKMTDEDKFALAMSGWIVGAEAATSHLESVDVLWNARDAVQLCLARDDGVDPALLLQLASFELTDPATGKKQPLDVSLLTRIVQLASPPLDDGSVVAEEPKLLRIHDDPNPQQPTEYTVLLPPEYHPLRSYPAVVALHSSRAASPAERTRSAVNGWATEASRRGYIVIAPEYTMRGLPLDYRYSPDEHAAVELALRDALRRFAIDSDRVFLGGVLLGANMAWDFGLGHPDLFAGVSVISGIAQKYVWAYKDNTKRVPFYITMGDLAPGQPKFFELAKSLIVSNYDVTYTELNARGLENFPEELPNIFDWMDRRKRDPYPKQFEVKTARSSDARFYGIVVRGFSPTRTVAPEAVDPLGTNVKPATVSARVNNVLNRLEVTTSGITKADIWVPLSLFDFTKRLEVRLNGTKTLYKAIPKVDFEPLLQDLRVRGDRKQLYGLKVSM